MDYVFIGDSHPEANGRKPIPGEEAFPMWFTTDEGGKVTVKLGRSGFINVAGCILRALMDDPVLRKEVVDSLGEVEVENFLELDTRKE